MLLERIQLEESEQVLKTVRQHWFIITTELLAVAVAAVAPFIFSGFLLTIPLGTSGTTIASLLSTSLIAFISSAWLLLCVMAAATIWTHYYLDLWIITDRRIILVNQKGFFNRNVSMFRLERLQDIEYYISGIVATLLNYGTIKAQTAGSFESNFRSTGLPDPRELQAIIQKATDERIHQLRGATIITE
jgi:hypothetical protein